MTHQANGVKHSIGHWNTLRSNRNTACVASKMECHFLYFNCDWDLNGSFFFFFQSPQRIVIWFCAVIDVGSRFSVIVFRSLCRISNQRPSPTAAWTHWTDESSDLRVGAAICYAVPINNRDYCEQHGVKEFQDRHCPIHSRIWARLLFLWSGFFFTLLKMTNKTTFEFIKHNLFLIKLQWKEDILISLTKN